MDINAFIDFTLLKSSTSEHDVVNLCNEVLNNNYHSICINGCYVPLAKQLLNKTSVKICSVVGFPLGAMETKAKVFEAKKAVENGADEIEMVINIGLLKSKNYMALLKDIIDVKLAIYDKPLKVILEISELSKNEIIKASQICMDANADYIKTSTGFTNNGATFTSIKIIKKTVREDIKIIASGGITDIDTAKKFIQLGVERISISQELKSSKASIPEEAYQTTDKLN